MASCHEVKGKHTVNLKCIVTDVEYFEIGKRHTLQTSPEWKIKTSCGMVHVFRYHINVGDTLLIKKIYINNQNKQK
jgi:hypothetical protein